MADTRTGPYEILIRFTCEIGEKFGVVRGSTIATKGFVVDDAGVITGKIDGGRDDHPHDFPTQDLPDYLGDRFTAFDAQLDIMRVETAELNKALEDALAEAGSSGQNVIVLRQQIADLTAEHDAAKAELTATSQALATAQTELSATQTAFEQSRSEAVEAAKKAAEKTKAQLAANDELKAQIKELQAQLDLAYSA
jgi:chromosome segregation ATPase